MNRARASKFVHQMMRPVMAQKIAAEADNVREFVSENLLLARMCMESGHISDRALGSLITGLRIVRTVADALKDARLCRIIDGAADCCAPTGCWRRAGDERRDAMRR